MLQTWLYHESNQQFRTHDAERRWAHLHNVDIKRLREVHLLIDELRTRLRQFHIFVPRDVESEQTQRRRNPIIQQQNLLNLKVCICVCLNRMKKLFVILDYHRWCVLSEFLYS